MKEFSQDSTVIKTRNKPLSVLWENFAPLLLTVPAQFALYLQAFVYGLRGQNKLMVHVTNCAHLIKQLSKLSKTLTFLFSLSLSQVVIKMVPVTSQLKRTDSKDGTYMEMKNSTGKCKV